MSNNFRASFSSLKQHILPDSPGERLATVFTWAIVI